MPDPAIGSSLDQRLVLSGGHVHRVVAAQHRNGVLTDDHADDHQRDPEVEKGVSVLGDGREWGRESGRKADENTGPKARQERCP